MDDSGKESDEIVEQAENQVVAAPEPKEADYEKFKKVSFELLDIGCYYGNQGVEKITSLPLYQKVDEMVNIADKFYLVKKHGEQLYTYLD